MEICEQMVPHSVNKFWKFGLKTQVLEKPIFRCLRRNRLANLYVKYEVYMEHGIRPKVPFASAILSTQHWVLLLWTFPAPEAIPGRHTDKRIILSAYGWSQHPIPPVWNGPIAHTSISAYKWNRCCRDQCNISLINSSIKVKCFLISSWHIPNFMVGCINFENRRRNLIPELNTAERPNEMQEKHISIFVSSVSFVYNTEVITLPFAHTLL